MSLSARRPGILLVITWIIVGVGGSVWFFNRPYHIQRREHEHAVYRTLLMDTDYWGKTLTISAATTPYFEQESPEDTWQFESLAEVYPDLQSETWQDAVAVNAGTHLFPSNLRLLSARYTTVAPSELNLYGGEIDEYLVFSEVGFNPDLTQAIVYVYASCGVFCGDGHAYFLERVQGRWVIMHREHVVYT